MQLPTLKAVFLCAVFGITAAAIAESPKPYAPPAVTTTPEKTDQALPTETITTFETEFLPGIKPCPSKQSSNGRLFNNCQDEAVLNHLSTRSPSDRFGEQTIVDDLVAPRGNLLRIDINRRVIFPKKSQTSEQ